jgi:hypothetical protein
MNLFCQFSPLKQVRAYPNQLAVEALATPKMAVSTTAIQTRKVLFISLKVALISCGKSKKNDYL